MHTAIFRFVSGHFPSAAETAGAAEDFSIQTRLDTFAERD
jgi:hypothetical protein